MKNFRLQYLLVIFFSLQCCLSYSQDAKKLREECFGIYYGKDSIPGIRRHIGNGDYWQSKNGVPYGKFYSFPLNPEFLERVGYFDSLRPGLLTGKLYGFERNKLLYEEDVELGVIKRPFNALAYNNGKGFEVGISNTLKQDTIISCPSGTKIIIKPGSFDKDAILYIHEIVATKDLFLNGLHTDAAFNQSGAIDHRGVLFIDGDNKPRKTIRIVFPGKKYAGDKEKDSVYFFNGTCYQFSELYWKKMNGIACSALSENYVFEIENFGWFAVGKTFPYSSTRHHVVLGFGKVETDFFHITWPGLRKGLYYKGMPITGYIFYKEIGVVLKTDLPFSSGDKFMLPVILKPENSNCMALFIVKHKRRNKYYFIKKKMVSLTDTISKKDIQLLTPEELVKAISEL